MRPDRPVMSAAELCRGEPRGNAFAQLCGALAGQRIVIEMRVIAGDRGGIESMLSHRANLAAWHGRRREWRRPPPPASRSRGRGCDRRRDAACRREWREGPPPAAPRGGGGGTP